jgi:hypothetical protein
MMAKNLPALMNALVVRGLGIAVVTGIQVAYAGIALN